MLNMNNIVDLLLYYVYHLFDAKTLCLDIDSISHLLEQQHLLSLSLSHLLTSFLQTLNPCSPPCSAFSPFLWCKEMMNRSRKGREDVLRCPQHQLTNCQIVKIVKLSNCQIVKLSNCQIVKEKMDMADEAERRIEDVMDRTAN